MIKCCITIFFLCSFSFASNIKIYVSKQLDITSLNKVQISKLYLKKVTTINNQKVIVYDNTNDYEEFTQYFLNKTPYQIHAYWMKQIFLGKKIAPQKLSQQQLNEKLHNTPNAIVYSSEKLEGKVVYEIQ